MKVDSSIFKKRMKELKGLSDHLVKSGESVMKENTPVAGGNARRNTRKISNSTIKANYPYAGPLDDGISPKAPKGFTKPTIEYWDKEADRYIKRI